MCWAPTASPSHQRLRPSPEQGEPCLPCWAQNPAKAKTESETELWAWAEAPALPTAPRTPLLPVTATGPCSALCPQSRMARNLSSHPHTSSTRPSHHSRVSAPPAGRPGGHPGSQHLEPKATLRAREGDGTSWSHRLQERQDPGSTSSRRLRPHTLRLFCGPSPTERTAPGQGAAPSVPLPCPVPQAAAPGARSPSRPAQR